MDPTDSSPHEEEEEQGQGAIPAEQLPKPEKTEQWDKLDLPSRPPNLDPVSGYLAAKGIGGAIVRGIKGIPPCVWVVNRHSEDITVVVSKYRPSRLLTGVGVNASATGAGLNYSTTTFVSPATQKTLAPQGRDVEGSIAVFPLWTRRDNFGVITVFKGASKELYIQNDRVPAGATAYFVNKPNLRILDYHGIEQKPPGR